MMSPLYLDNGTITQPTSHVIHQMLPFFRRYWHAEHAPYVAGKEPFASLNRSVRAMRALIGAKDEDSFLFTSSGAHAWEILYRDVFLSRIVVDGCHQLLTTSIEEVGMRSLLKEWEKGGCAVKDIPLNSVGQVTATALKQALSPRTALVSLAWANSLSGVIHPIWELAEVCREHGVYFHVDASAVIGKLYFQFRDLPIDFLTFDGTRIHGPRGSGVLVSSKSSEVTSLHTDVNAAALIGLGVACEEALDRFDHLSMETARLRDTFEQELVSGCGAHILFDQAERLPHVSALTFPGVSGELLAFSLKEAGIFASSGGVRYAPLSDLLTTLGATRKEAHEALSFGLSYLTTEEEIRRAVGTIVDEVHRCRALSKEVCR